MSHSQKKLIERIEIEVRPTRPSLAEDAPPLVNPYPCSPCRCPFVCVALGHCSLVVK